ncbi:PilX N-terminal domain-containing pilus assembly protein [Pseudomonadota bacterium]
MLKDQTMNKQQGAVLIIALLFLLIVTLLGVSAMQSSVMEERMAGNMHDHNMAFQAAESGLKDGWDWLLPLTGRPLPDGTASNGVYTDGSIGAEPADYIFDWEGLGTDYGANTSNNAGDFPHNAKPPIYVIEEAAFVSDSLNPESKAKGAGKYYYRVSAVGYGGSDASEVVVQSVYEKRFK